ncbi:MAG: MutS family DNA mismatch repair protein [Phototrophicaceae bacterium]
MTQDRVQTYNRQIKRLSRAIKQLEAKSDKLGNWRLLLALGGGIPLFISIFLPYPLLFWGILSLVIIGFVFLIANHRRIEYTLSKYRTWRTIKQENRARMLLDWKRIPETHIEAEQDPLEVDLDLRELHRLLNTASSQSGTLRLRNWLINQEPSLATIEQRQKLVSEIKNRPTFRDKLTLNSRLSSVQVRKQLNTSWLRNWLDADIDPNKVNNWVMLLSTLAVANVIAFVLVQFNVISVTLSGVLWGLYALLYVSRIGMMNQLSGDGQQVYDVLSRLQSVMKHLESYPYQTMPNLRKLCTPLLEAKPSQQIRRLMGTLAASSLKANPPLWILLNALMPWDLFFLSRLNQQKQQLAHYMPQWLDVWYEIEALNSLATFAYLNDEAIIPNLSHSEVFSATQLGHPLLSSEKRITNDFSFGSVGELAILTGSNMSGKSSFLRTLSVNLTMAYAGGVVLAETFDAGIFRIFTCIRVTDSLDDGISYFYAEVKRLRALLDALEDNTNLPLFFVIDEIFRGTNNRERLIGSQSFINALVDANGLGLIATHDLELTQLADGNPKIRNLHFREHIADNRMVFDYILREGASPTTNALEIMALEGLPVDDTGFKKQMNK